MRFFLIALAGVFLLSQAKTIGDVLWKDDFRSVRRYETLGLPCIEVRDGRCCFSSSDKETILFTPLDDLTDATIRTSLTVQKRLGGTFATAGAYIHADAGNLWKLMLVESPAGKRYMELLEEYGGIHQAQLSSGLALPSKFEGDLTTWDYGVTYELVLALQPDRIVGEIRDAATGQYWRKTYDLGSSRAVKRGRPALAATGLECYFENLTVEGSLPPALPGFSVAAGKEGTVVILRDDAAGVIAEKLKPAMERAGFGVTMLSWDDLGKGRIPPEKVDLLIVADARRLPVTAKPSLIAFLRSHGKAMFIGAPAFGELLGRGPQGWLSKADYETALAGELKPVPLPFADERWRRSAMRPDRAGKIEPDPAEPEGCFKISVDLEGWDNFGRALKTPLPEGHSITTFWAKGDEKTPQLSVEWVEADGARWIGAVPLTTSWKQYVMRCGDFPNWPDSKSKRGGAGDRLNPQNVATITFGLSKSHTPKCEPGAHTYWIRDIASAADPGGEEPDFRPPEIEALCPSYKLYPLSATSSLAPAPDQRILPQDWKAAWNKKAYSPVPREAGRGFDRCASWRWIPIVEAADAEGRTRGTLISLMLGNSFCIDAIWANVAVAEPADALDTSLLEAVSSAARAMAKGCFLAEAGSRFFSYPGGPGERPVELGAEVANTGRMKRSLSLRAEIYDADRRPVFQEEGKLDLGPGERGRTTWTWKPDRLDPRGYTVQTTLLENGIALDAISHPLDCLPSEPPRPDEYVTVQGSNFYLGGKKWFMLGINYRQSMMAGYPTLDLLQRNCYDPVLVEKDLAAMQSLGINFISATHALVPPKPDEPDSYRDVVDFLNRCRNHGMKVFYFLPWGNPFLKADVEQIKRHLEVSGIKDHPAIFSWELAWEPIYSFGKKKTLPDLRREWTKWIEQRYGSVSSAERDWGFALESQEGLVSIPASEMCLKHGAWDKAVAAFRRFYSDYVSQLYLKVCNELREFDPKHLISFRGGGCSIPAGARFAHLHSVGVAKHIDFLCPEGYSLMSHGWGKPTPPDDIRKGGLITLYYRFVSREKPVVWMEFGYTVRGFHTDWKTEMVHVSEEELVNQKIEHDSFYKMFLESGARGAAPWWLPGGFRLGECSDFGVLNEDLTERPVCEVIRRSLPLFEKVEHAPPTTHIDMDLDAHYADAWEFYSDQYLQAVKAGQRPYLKTAGTGADSANTPLIAVGDTPCNGHNPPKYLNAEFNRIEICAGSGQWREVHDGETIEVKAGDRLLCRASAGNIAEAKWLAPRADLKEGGVYLAGRKEYGLEFKAPIAADADYLKDAQVREFVLIPSATGTQTASFEMLAENRTHFGQRITITVKAD